MNVLVQYTRDGKPMVEEFASWEAAAEAVDRLIRQKGVDSESFLGCERDEIVLLALQLHASIIRSPEEIRNFFLAHYAP